MGNRMNFLLCTDWPQGLLDVQGFSLRLKASVTPSHKGWGVTELRVVTLPHIL